MLRFTLLLLVAAASTWRMSAQQSVTGASLEGRVTDPTGALIAGAIVTATNQATHLRNQSTTSTDGHFQFSYLSVGHYAVTAAAPSLQGVTHVVDCVAGSSLRVDLTLRPSAGTTTITSGEDLQPAMDTRTEVAAQILPDEVTQLPFPSRNFLDLALLAPGVSQTNTASTQLFAETSAVPGQGLSINSQRNFSNSFLVDGLSVNDDAAGLVQTAFPLDSIAQLQVVTSGGQAEFGRALGGYLNFITRSGASNFHGTGYGYLRNQRLNAANALTRTILPVTQAQFGASLGGPVVHDRTFFFINAEQRNLQQNGVITITPANAAVINARLTTVGYAGSLLAIQPVGSTTLYPNPSHATNVFSKLDHRFSDRDSLSVRYSMYRVSSLNSRGAGSLSYVSAAATLEDFDQTLAASNIFAPSSKTLNETRAQFTRSQLNAPPNDRLGPAVSISGVATFGTLSSSPTTRNNDLVEVVDNLSHTWSSHTFRSGIDFLNNALLIDFPQSARGNYAFSSLANFQAGRYSTFTQSFGKTSVSQRNPNLGFYAQDQWRASPALTLNAGLRYDLQFLRSIATDTNNISPRIGLAWTPFCNHQTVIRAAFGFFYDRVPLRALSNALESNGNSTALSADTFVTLALSSGQSGAPVFPEVASGFTAANLPAGLRLSLTTMDQHVENALGQQSSLELEQQLSAGSTFSLSYQHLRGRHLLLSVNLNTPSCLASVDPVNLCRPNNAFANNKQYRSAADSTYDGLAASLVQRPSRFGSYRISYTWSHSIDNVGEFFFSSPINNADLTEDRSRSDDDQRHRFLFDAMVNTSMTSAHTMFGHLSHGFRLSGILQYTSALPFNVVTGGNTIQTTTQRPCAAGFPLTAAGGVNPCTLGLRGAVIGRDAGVGFDAFMVSTRLSRTFPLGDRLHLEGIAQAFNALNHRNNQIPIATFGTGAYPTQPAPNFGAPSAAGDARSVELAMRLIF